LSGWKSYSFIIASSLFFRRFPPFPVVFLYFPVLFRYFSCTFPVLFLYFSRSFPVLFFPFPILFSVFLAVIKLGENQKRKPKENQKKTGRKKKKTKRKPKENQRKEEKTRKKRKPPPLRIKRNFSYQTLVFRFMEFRLVGCFITVQRPNPAAACLVLSFVSNATPTQASRDDSHWHEQPCRFFKNDQSGRFIALVLSLIRQCTHFTKSSCFDSRVRRLNVY